jgi:predicted Fe-Mo cluster-binding NifX family protein
MKIAVTYSNNEVFGHFGHTEQFKFYDVENNEIKSTNVVNTNGSGHGALASFLKENKVDVLICGGIGGGAKNALAEADIKIYPGITGSADVAVDKLLNGTLEINEGHCDHHHHDKEDHKCHCDKHGCKGN